MVKDDRSVSVFRTMTYGGKPTPKFNCNLALFTAYKQRYKTESECNTLRTTWAGDVESGIRAMLRLGNNRVIQC
jgi:hypothetical protein